MINLRYHIVSLVAVFFALGVGIIMGTTVIDKGLVGQLNAQTRSLDNRLTAARADSDALKKKQDLWESFGKSAFAPIMKGKLKGRPVVLVTQEGSDGHVIDAVSQAITDAGATLAGRVNLTSKWAVKDQPAKDALAAAAGLVQPIAGDIVAQAATRLGTRLSLSADPAVAGDPLSALRDAGYVSVDAASPGAFPRAGSALVVLPAALKDIRSSQIFFPLLQGLARSRPAAVAESIDTPDSLVDRVRGDGALASTVATVDDVDVSLGRLSLVFSLRTLFAGGGALHYGTRRGATALAPTTFGA